MVDIFHFGGWLVQMQGGEKVVFYLLGQITRQHLGSGDSQSSVVGKSRLQGPESSKKKSDCASGDDLNPPTWASFLSFPFVTSGRLFLGGDDVAAHRSQMCVVVLFKVFEMVGRSHERISSGFR